MSSLNSLELDGNEISRLDIDAFFGLGGEILDLPTYTVKAFLQSVIIMLLSSSMLLTADQERTFFISAFGWIDDIFFVIFSANLQYLRLGDNNLHEIPSDALRALHRLRHLDLRANNISSIPDDAFLGYGDTITFLNLQKNK